MKTTVSTIKTIQIDLAEFTSPKDHSLNSKALGEKLHDTYAFDKPAKDTVFNIFVPHNIYSVMMSFFEPAFGTILSLLGKDNFRKTFVFEAESGSAQRSINMLIDEMWSRYNPTIYRKQDED